MSVTIKIAVFFWDMMTCSLADLPMFQRNMLAHLQGRRVILM
jgi:hypothetical protein